MSNRSKFVSLVSYLPADLLIAGVKNHRNEFAFCEMIVHDHDDGKEPHIHVNAEFFSSKQFSQVRKMFESFGPGNTLVKETLNTRSAHDYLTHLNAPAKFQYAFENIKVLVGDVNDYVNNSTDYEERKSKKDADSLKKNERAMELIDDIIAKKSTRELIAKYGRDYMRNRAQYHQIAQIVMIEENASQRDVVEVGRSFEYMVSVLDERESRKPLPEKDDAPFQNLPDVNPLGGI